MLLRDHPGMQPTLLVFFPKTGVQGIASDQCTPHMLARMYPVNKSITLIDVMKKKKQILLISLLHPPINEQHNHVVLWRLSTQMPVQLEPVY